MPTPTTAPEQGEASAADSADCQTDLLVRMAGIHPNGDMESMGVAWSTDGLYRAIQQARVAGCDKLDVSWDIPGGVHRQIYGLESEKARLMDDYLSALQSSVPAFAKPDGVKLLQWYPYWTAVVYLDENRMVLSNGEDAVFERGATRPLELELARQHGLGPDNHTCARYLDAQGVERGVWFHDFHAIFGKVSERRS